MEEMRLSLECPPLNGVQNRGEQQLSVTGQRCINWLHASSRLNSSIYPDTESGVWNHSYCRNPDDSDILWCYVLTQDGSVQKQHCHRDKCTDTVQSPANPDTGISRPVRQGPKKKRDLGVLGYVMGSLLMAISLLLASGIVIGYFYKKTRNLIREQEREACERETHRSNLPLSAFSNLACNLLDENTASAHGQERTEAVGEEREEDKEGCSGHQTSDPSEI
ncbi:phosphoinositide-3-kinase-interacting protein 1-like [Osmerus eperlanus]|uniref:phosphoinositide-3-kinase-interacting protein 1-like n=1 Tax=Osmerus eperlanus TaxID=29151 RepID=UPI002E0F07FE